MVISEQHKYLFVEHAMSGCTAIRKELIKQYGGQTFLYKHASIHDFNRVATPAQAEYFSFAAIRNPMDQVVSKYLKHAHRKSRKAGPRRRGGKRGRTRLFWSALLRRAKQRNVAAANASFEKFFLGLYVLPYTDWSVIGHKYLDHVMRFERLQDDFRAVVQKLDLEYKGPVPATNQTPGKEAQFLDFYSAALTKRAKFVFEPHLRFWNYPSSDSWDELPRSRLSFFLFSVLNKINWIYYHLFR